MAVVVQSVRARGKEKTRTTETINTAEEVGKAMTTRGSPSATSHPAKLEDLARGRRKGVGMMKGKMEEGTKRSRARADRIDAGLKVRRGVTIGEKLTKISQAATMREIATREETIVMMSKTLGIESSVTTPKTKSKETMKSNLTLSPRIIRAGKTKIPNPKTIGHKVEKVGTRHHLKLPVKAEIQAISRGITKNQALTLVQKKALKM